MKKQGFLATVTIIGSLGLVVVLGAMAAAPQLRGTERTRPVAARHRQQPAQDDAYTGRIVKRLGSCVLVNPNTETTYVLDNQHKAMPFLGKDVLVIGTLNLIRKTIHVAEIRFNKSS
ncbi:MAG TPA: hypothetical protein VMI06_05085 [Terriglobia bacterium]|nr:hypothetical protein [Terriglobia bacterium]